jgi:hypothetical protein
LAFHISLLISVSRRFTPLSASGYRRAFGLLRLDRSSGVMDPYLKGESFTERADLAAQ